MGSVVAHEAAVFVPRGRDRHVVEEAEIFNLGAVLKRSGSGLESGSRSR